MAGFRYKKAPPSDQKPATFLDNELQRIEAALRNIDADTLTLANAATFNGGLLLANAQYINWYNAAGVASVVGVGLNAVNQFVICNEAQNNSQIYFQVKDSAGTVRKAGAFSHASVNSFSIFTVNAGDNPFIAFFNLAGTRQGYLQSQATMFLQEVETASSQFVWRARDAASAGRDMQWQGANQKLFLNNGKDTIDSSDGYLRLNQSGSYANPIFSPGKLRIETAYVGSNDAQGWNAAITLAGSYGNIQTVGAGNNAWQGYNIHNRVSVMENGAGIMGSYNIFNAQWLIQHTFNGQTLVYGAGIATLQVLANLCNIWDGGAYRKARSGNSFKSAQQAVAASGSVAHSLGKIPENWQVVLVCTTAEKGYSIGDEVDLGDVWFAGGGASPGTGWADATNIGWSMLNTTPSFYNKAAATLSAITAANWRIVVKGQTDY